MSFTSAIPIIGDLIDLGSELIEDPDKKNEYAFELKKEVLEYQKTIIQTKTNPKVDALVKLMYAVSDIIKQSWRPVIGACMTAFGMYAHYKGIDMSEISHTVFDGAFPAWGASRHIEKKKKAEKKKAPKEEPEEWWFED